MTPPDVAMLGNHDNLMLGRLPVCIRVISADLQSCHVPKSSQKVYLQIKTLIAVSEKKKCGKSSSLSRLSTKSTDLFLFGRESFFSTSDAFFLCGLKSHILLLQVSENSAEPKKKPRQTSRTSELVFQQQ